MRRAFVMFAVILAMPFGGAVSVTEADARAAPPEGVGPPDGVGPPGGWNCGDDDDAYEGPAGNDTIHQPYELAYTGRRGRWERDAWASVEDAFLCSGNDDWFLLPRAFEPWVEPKQKKVKGEEEEEGWEDEDGPPPKMSILKVRAQARGAPYCYDCGGSVPDLDPAPENTLSVDVHQINDHQPLLGTRTSQVGNAWLGGRNSVYDDGLLLRFYGPPEAEYDYRFYVYLQNTSGEDECEC
jgi:hypothetical protein